MDTPSHVLAWRVYVLQRACGNPRLQAVLMELCRRDPVFWFDMFCWTVDPRRQPAVVPFVLYPFQRWAVRQWYGCIEAQQDFGIEKSRDMGVSWLLVLLFQYGWLFRPGWHFLLGSRKEAEVDTVVIDPSTLFGKLRFNLLHLPVWMRPTAYRDKKLAMVNEDNGNTLTGESANAFFGRGQRQRAILLDEFAFWDYADAVYGGCSATTNCRIVTSTPYGRHNRFAQLMHDPANERREPPPTD
ncbi:MAG: hypothetical protein KC476_08090 [Cyanobacteria bacterium HKST-UBA06]|nr:hypothetical protein [Cyanobacteria bacterium HKST-UBA04]MCA9807900.1 hypothetical protein [Cyanobacteria bacterium HKST-UBA06]